MIKFKKENIEAYVPIQLTCDICKKSYSMNQNENELTQLEVEEFIRIDHTGGYMSIFGDMLRIRIDLCQRCFKEKLGEYIRLGEDDAEENS